MPSVPVADDSEFRLQTYMPKEILPVAIFLSGNIVTCDAQDYPTK
jgi:hypothetical protein